MARETIAEIMADVDKDTLASKPRKVAHNTVEFETTDGYRVIRFHQTNIISVKGGTYTLNTGGWKTVTTKERLNRFSPARIWSHKGEWLVAASTPGRACQGGDKVPFYDGIQVDEGGNVLDPAEAMAMKKANLDISREIKKFVGLIDNLHALPRPDGGDCWHCLMFDKEDEGSRDPRPATDRNTDHLRSHMAEEYIPGSLLVNAMRWAGHSDEGIGVHYQMRLRDTFKRTLRRYMRHRFGLPV